MILKMTKDEENKLIDLLQDDSIGDKVNVTIQDKKRIVNLCLTHGLRGIAQDLEAMDLRTFKDYLVNDIYS